MSEEQFRRARSELALSQKIRDSLIKQAPTYDENLEAPVEPQEAPGQEEMIETPQEPQEGKGLIQGVVEAIQPMFEEIKGLFSAKKEEPQEVELKIDGEMKPKEEAE